MEAQSVVYEVSIEHKGKTEKVCGNWAGVISKIYNTLGEDNVKMLTSNLQEAQAEMFFEQWVNMQFGVPEYKIIIKTVQAKEDTCGEDYRIPNS